MQLGRRLVSRLNHSCRPNAAYVFRHGGATVSVRSLRVGAHLFHFSPVHMSKACSRASSQDSQPNVLVIYLLTSLLSIEQRVPLRLHVYRPS